MVVAAGLMQRSPDDTMSSSSIRRRFLVKQRTNSIINKTLTVRISKRVKVDNSRMSAEAINKMNMSHRLNGEK